MTMYDESGFGAGGSPYQYTVAVKTTPALRIKKLLMICLYVVYALGVLLIGTAARIIAPLLAFIPVTLWILIFFTWRYTQVSYEYSFQSGLLKVSRLFGERTKRPLVELKIRNLDAVCFCDFKGQDRVASYEPKRTFFAASHADAERLAAALWTDEAGVRCVLYFEADEKALRILRYYNSSAVLSE